MTLLALALSATAAVPDGAPLNAQTFRPSTDSYTFFRTVGPELPERAGSAAAVMSYTLDPLVYTAPDGTRTSVVANVLQLDVTAAYRLGPISFGADIPVYLRSFGGTSPDATGIGDPMFTGKVQVLEPGEAPVGLAALVRGYVPISAAPDGLGASGSGVDLALAASRRVGRRIEVGVDAGVALTPTVALPGGTWGSQLYVDVGGAFTLTPKAGVVAELHAAGLLDDMDAGEASPIEALVGGWYRLGGHRSVSVRPALGFGLTDAVGSPRVRALVSLSYDPPARPVGEKPADGR